MAVQTFAAIQAYNNGLSNFANGAGTWYDATKGVIIHKIDTATAEAISTRIKPCAAQYGLPLPYALACLAVESTLDPACQNGNLGPGESNTANDPLGYDMGLPQFKLRFLVNVAPGCSDAVTAKAFALDIDRAIPYFCSIMQGNIEFAQSVIAQNTSSAPDPRMNNPFAFATSAYNFGRSGVMPLYESGQFPHHAQMVADMSAYFAKELGLPDPMAI